MEENQHHVSHIRKIAIHQKVGETGGKICVIPYRGLELSDFGEKK
jgi:hypothetical protein